MIRFPLATDSRPRRLDAALAALLLAVLLVAGGCRPKKGPEEGFIPLPEGPVWVTYQLDGRGHAIFQGDVVFDLDWLRDWQQTVDLPRPLDASHYDIANGLTALDTTYDGAGDPEGASAPLVGGNGVLTDGLVPEPVAWYSLSLAGHGWVNWQDPTLLFHFPAGSEIDALTLHFNTEYEPPAHIEVEAGGTVRSFSDPVSEWPTGGAVTLSGLDLVGETVEIRIFGAACGFLAAPCHVVLGEVVFETGTVPATANIKAKNNWSPEIPYEIAEGFDLDETVEIVDAIQTWNEKSDVELYVDAAATPRIRIRPKTADDPDSSNCFANGIGRPSGDGVREVVLVPGCSPGNVVHELGHALGLSHEHQRRDRTDHIVFRSNNIVVSKRLRNYSLKGKPFGEYDYRSIMHYSETSFGRSMCCQEPGLSGDFNSAGGLPEGCAFFDMVGTDDDGDGRFDSGDDSCPAAQPYDVPLTVMKSRRPLPDHPATRLGQRLGLSKGDVAGVNAMVNDDSLGWRSYNSLSTLQAMRSADYITQHMADVNGDGFDDLVSFAKGPGSQDYQGDVEVALGDAEGRLTPAGVWHPDFCFNGEHCLVGDPDGDGLADIVSVDPSTGDVRVSLSDGNWFRHTPGDLGLWSDTLGSWHGYPIALADVDGDCRDDLILMGVSIYNDAWLTIAYSEPGGFGAPTVHLLDHERLTGDFADVDADGRADFVSWNDAGDVFVELGTGDGFAAPVPWAYGFCGSDVQCQLRDANDDGRADLVRLEPAAEHHLDRVRVAPSSGYAFHFAVPQYHEIDCRAEGGCNLGDVNGDGELDVIDVIDHQEAYVGSHDHGRDEYGATYVSLGTTLWHDSIGSLKPVPWDAPSRSLAACLDLGFDL